MMAPTRTTTSRIRRINSLCLVAAAATTTTTTTSVVAVTAASSRSFVRPGLVRSGFVTTACTSSHYRPTQATTTPTTTFRRNWTMVGKNKPTARMSSMTITRRYSSSSSDDETSTQKPKKELPYPRAAVAVAVRCCCATTTTSSSSNNHQQPINDVIPHYLLVQRGNPPNAGLWSFPGGKLELGETTLDGARRELAEETAFRWNNKNDSGSSESSSESSSSSDDDDDDIYLLSWYLGGSWTTADSIVWASPNTEKEQEQKPESNLLAHYLIGICFAEINIPQTLTTGNHSHLPLVQAMDDAADARWFSIERIKEMQSKQETTPGILDKVQRAELLYQNGMLPTSV